MTEINESQIVPALEDAEPPEPSARFIAAPAWTYRAVVAVVVGIAVIGATQVLTLYFPDTALLLLRIVLALAVAALCWGVAARHHRQWVGPVRQLEKLIDDVRKGDAPIDELNTIVGHLHPVAQLIKEVMHEWRRQAQAIDEMHEEIRLRVAGRTSALERTIQTLRQQAVRDPLTGFYNRRMLDEFLPRLIQQSVARSSPMALLMIDVDYFKDLNDTLGHAAGDDMLRAFGQLFHSAIRDGDMAFRCGGDEFVILLAAGCEATGAANKSDRLQSLVAGLVSTLKVPRPPKLSIGIACLSELADPTADNLMRIADQKLYAVKAARGSASRSAALNQRSSFPAPVAHI